MPSNSIASLPSSAKKRKAPAPPPVAAADVAAAKEPIIESYESIESSSQVTSVASSIPDTNGDDVNASPAGGQSSSSVSEMSRRSPSPSAAAHPSAPVVPVADSAAAAVEPPASANVEPVGLGEAQILLDLTRRHEQQQRLHSSVRLSRCRSSRLVGDEKDENEIETWNQFLVELSNLFVADRRGPATSTQQPRRTAFL